MLLFGTATPVYILEATRWKRERMGGSKGYFFLRKRKFNLSDRCYNPPRFLFQLSVLTLIPTFTTYLPVLDVVCRFFFFGWVCFYPDSLPEHRPTDHPSIPPKPRTRSSGPRLGSIVMGNGSSRPFFPSHPTATQHEQNPR